MTDTTVLTLAAFGIPPYSIRGATQTLEPIEASKQTKRTLNGTLVDLSLSQFRKYKSTISCADQTAPALDGVFPGAQVTVGCLIELAIVGTPNRSAVAGSQYSADGFTFYRPSLIMRVLNFSAQFDEYAATYTWSIELEEV